MAGADFNVYALRIAEASAFVRPLVCVPVAHRHLGWLIAPEIGRLEFQGDDTAGIAIPVKLERILPTGPVKLQHALRRRVMLTHLPDAHRVPHAFAFRAAAKEARQEFSLEPIQIRRQSAALTAIASELTDSLAVASCFQDVLLALRRGQLRATLADSALRCLPLDELAALGRHLLENPHDLALLQQAMPGNPWFHRRLPKLIAWRQARTQTPPQAALSHREPSSDLAGARGDTSQPTNLGLVVTGYARAAIPPRRMACLLATARNEGPYLLEWIAYHRAIGFEHIFLYTNDNSDGSDDLLRLLAGAGIINWFDNQVLPGTLPQHRAYGHALAAMPEILDYRWTMIADIDEFVGFDTRSFHSITDYIEWQEQSRAEAIALPWKLHVAKPDDVWHEAPCIERFPLRDPAINAYVKTLFRTNMAWGANPHYPQPCLGAALIQRSESGEPHMQRTTPAQTAKPSARFGWVSHYAFRSTPEMIMKLGRGRADQPASAQDAAVENRIRTFLEQLRIPGLVEDRSTLLCGEGLAKERAQLMTIPGLAACEAEIKRAYSHSLRRACEEFLQSATYSSDHSAMLRSLMSRSLAA